MAKQKVKVDPMNEIKDLIKMQLVLDMFSLNISQGEISRKLHMDINVVNKFLKGFKKK